MQMFKCVGEHLLREYFIEDGLFTLRVWNLDEGKEIWRGVVPRVQFYRGAILCIRGMRQNRKVALLDNGDITSSNE